MLTCPGCRRGGHTDGPVCPRCNLYLVIRDPAPPGPDEMPAVALGDTFQAFWEASCDAAQGLKSGAELIDDMQFLLRNLNRGRAFAPQAVDQVLRGMDLIRRFADTREVAYINQGWVLIISAAAVLVEIAVQKGMIEDPEIIAQEEESSQPLMKADFGWLLSEEAAEIEWDPNNF